MQQLIGVEIVSAEEAIFSGPAKMVIAPASMGEVGILPRHAPLLASLRPGEIRVLTPDDEELFFYVSGGILEIQPDVVTVLADTVIRAKDIDEAAALEAKRRAEQMIQSRDPNREPAWAYAELQRALAQLRAAEHERRRRGGKGRAS